MLQRIQTLFLLGALAVGIIMFFIPLGHLITSQDILVDLYYNGIRQSELVENEYTALPLTILLYLATAITFITIFLYKKIIFSIIVSFAGLIMLFGENFNNLNKIGILLALGASISYSVYAIYGRHILNTIPLSVTTAYICFFAAFTFLAAGLYQNKLNFSFTPVSWIYVGLITLITVGGFLSFFAGIKLTSPTIVSILGMTEPIMTIILSFIIFSEQFTIIQMMGVGLVLTASTQVLFKKNKKILKKY